MITNPTVQRISQVLAFVPPVVVYLLLKPETFASSSAMQLSTSQAVAISTGFAASVAFAIFQKAAIAHPESAMALGLPEPKAPPPAADDDDGDGGSSAPRPSPSADADADADAGADSAALKTVPEGSKEA
jgi:phosphatidylglycerol:prolipoprotein diacylglycerol transferase